MSAQGGDYCFNTPYYHWTELAGPGFGNRWHIVNSKAVFCSSWKSAPGELSRCFSLIN